MKPAEILREYGPFPGVVYCVAVLTGPKSQIRQEANLSDIIAENGCLQPWTLASRPK
jgi:hypothetical protein